MAILTPPCTYFEWVEVLDMLIEETNDNEVLQALQSGTIEWQQGVSERFTAKLVEAVNLRLKAATDKFNRNINNARGQESYVAQALLSLRKEMSFLSRVINLPAIPEQDRVQYCIMIQKQADAMQILLEDSAKSDRSGKLTNIIRNHRINVFGGEVTDGCNNQ
jgi:hypothetical protein